MKWSSHYIPIQAPVHERSIETQPFENIHLVLFLDSQISLGILLIYGILTQKISQRSY